MCLTVSQFKVIRLDGAAGPFAQGTQSPAASVWTHPLLMPVANHMWVWTSETLWFVRWLLLNCIVNLVIRFKGPTMHWRGDFYQWHSGLSANRTTLCKATQIFFGQICHLWCRKGSQVVVLPAVVASRSTWHDLSKQTCLLQEEAKTVFFVIVTGC